MKDLYFLNEMTGEFRDNVALMSRPATDLSRLLEPYLTGAGRRRTVAKRLHVSLATVGRWASGRDTPSFQNLMWLCDMCGIDHADAIAKSGKQNFSKLYEEWVSENRKGPVGADAHKHATEQHGRLCRLLGIILANGTDQDIIGITRNLEWGAAVVLGTVEPEEKTPPGKR